MSRIVRFEIHASQPQAPIEFYTELLGWRFNKVEPLGYWRIQTGPSGESGIDGGLVQRPCASPGTRPAVNAFICTVEVGSLDETLARAESLGAVVALPRMPVPRMGWLAYIMDPDGNVLGLLQPDETVQ